MAKNLIAEDATNVSENVKKYRTVARAVLANDADAAHELYDILKEKQGPLKSEEINALGFQWFMAKKSALTPETALFLAEVGFDFKQIVRLSEEERAGKALPFRLIGNDTLENVLLALIDHKYVELDIMDGAGDSLLVEALLAERFDFAKILVNKGLDVNAVNLYGETPLHVCASKLGFQQVQFLVQEGADPTIESLNGMTASECVPDEMPGWDPNLMFEELENYSEAYKSGTGSSFVFSDDYDQTVIREKGPQEGDEPSEDDEQVVKNLIGGL